jgi:transcriptional regulator with XRE-family HTH domain
VTIFPPDPDFNALRLELARLRAARGWTYDELAARSGLARRTLIEIEQGRTIGTLKTWHALAHALGIPLDERDHGRDDVRRRLLAPAARRARPGFTGASSWRGTAPVRSSFRSGMWL